MRAHLFLYEEVDPTREDLASVAQWLSAAPDQIEVHIKQEPIDKFLGQIKEMHGTFSEFPKDERRTNKILRLLKQGATPMPMYVEQGDKDLFVMEGRHRMVAFWLAGMTTVPVAYVSKKLDETINPDIMNSGFEHTQKIGDYTYTASSDGRGYLYIECHHRNKQIGRVDFYVRNGALESEQTEVEPEYQRMGIASTMYAYAKMLGNDVKPSSNLLRPGKNMWRAWRKSGDDKHLVAEDSYSPPTLHTGDKILKGKFKNSPAEIKGFTKDKHNQPVLKTNKGDIQLFKPRVVKLMPDKLDEYEGGVTPTENSKAIFDKLQGLGYKKLGSGADATVWAKDSDHVIKILMPRRTLPSEVANAEKGFMTFYDFCKKHPELPNLPRFIDIGGEHHTVFDINGTPYRQIAMERLQHIPNGSFEEAMVWMLADLSKYGASWPNIVQQMKKPITWQDSGMKMKNIPQEVARRFADQAVSTRYGILSVTMGRLYRAGIRSGLGWDLHTDNVMMRRDGTLVIVDPFFT